MTISRYPNPKKQTPKPASKTKMPKEKRQSLEEVTYKAQPYGDKGTKLAALKYVNQGLKNLNLKPREEIALREKLLPSVERTISQERNRTLMRGQSMERRAKQQRLAKAEKKIRGGK